MNIRTKISPSPKSGFASLDTLAQLSTKRVKNQAQTQCNCGKEKLQKRAKRKSITDALVYRLVNIDSPLNKAYWNTYHCSSTITQEGNKIKTTYCKNRWCNVCNSIRTAQLILGYRDPLMNLNDPHFVTLTLRSISGRKLSQTITDMQNSLNRIRKRLHKRGTPVKGIRKLECNYNKNRSTYNPHFHLIVQTEEAAKLLVKEWRKEFPKSTGRKAQHIESVNDFKGRTKEASMLELFKYFTKVVTKEGFHPKQMDTIFQAMKGRRTVQTMGIKMVKVSDEDLDNIEAKTIDHKEEGNYQWDWQRLAFDWVNGDGELLSEYDPSTKELEFISMIKHPPKEPDPPELKATPRKELTPNQVNQILSQWRAKE